MIKAWIKEPYGKSHLVSLPEDRTELQKTIGGYIEVVYITDGMVILCDEEGKLKYNKDKKAKESLPYCCTPRPNLNLVGTVIVCGIDKRYRFTDCPVDNEYVFRKVFPGMWEV